MAVKKIIGIVSGMEKENERIRYCLNQVYCEAVIYAGALPFIVPYDTGAVEQICSLLDGIIFSGGGDIDPRYFGQSTNEKTSNIIPERDEFEVLLCNAAYARDIPTLGICRGIQIMNVACGGTLRQHIEGHAQSKQRHIGSHTVKISKESRLSEIFKKETILVNSFHHQAAERAGDGLVISAVSEDGCIEALEAPSKKFFIGVQWHPESYVGFDNEQLKLFKVLTSG